MSIFHDFSLKDCIISITLDNASANVKAISYFEQAFVPQNGGQIFHQKCACHVINLIVKSGLKVLNGPIEKIRDLCLGLITQIVGLLNSIVIVRPQIKEQESLVTICL